MLIIRTKKRPRLNLMSCRVEPPRHQHRPRWPTLVLPEPNLQFPGTGAEEANSKHGRWRATTGAPGSDPGESLPNLQRAGTEAGGANSNRGGGKAGPTRPAKWETPKTTPRSRRTRRQRVRRAPSQRWPPEDSRPPGGPYRRRRRTRVWLWRTTQPRRAPGPPRAGRRSTEDPSGQGWPTAAEKALEQGDRRASGAAHSQWKGIGEQKR